MARLRQEPVRRPHLVFRCYRKWIDVYKRQPVDITLRAERIRPDGSVLPEESLHGGKGMDILLDCFDFTLSLIHI